jgi:hypothetical protein
MAARSEHSWGQGSIEKPQQWSGEDLDHRSYIDPFSNFNKTGQGVNEDTDGQGETFQKRAYTGKVTDYTLEQPEEEDEGYRLRTKNSTARKTEVKSDSYLFTWGEGKAGQLAQQSNDDILIPYAVNAFLNMPIKSCALGKKHSLFLTEKGR